jgi:hypothetical protein
MKVGLTTTAGQRREPRSCFPAPLRPCGKPFPAERQWGRRGNGVRSVRLTFERVASPRSCGSRAPPLPQELQGYLLNHRWNRRVEIGSSSRRDATVRTRRFAALLGPPTICQMDRSDPIAPPHSAFDSAVDSSNGQIFPPCPDPVFPAPLRLCGKPSPRNLRVSDSRMSMQPLHPLPSYSDSARRAVLVLDPNTAPPTPQLTHWPEYE